MHEFIQYPGPQSLPARRPAGPRHHPQPAQRLLARRPDPARHRRLRPLGPPRWSSSFTPTPPAARPPSRQLYQELHRADDQPHRPHGQRRRRQLAESAGHTPSRWPIVTLSDLLTVEPLSIRRRPVDPARLHQRLRPPQGRQVDPLTCRSPSPSAPAARCSASRRGRSACSTSPLEDSLARLQNRLHKMGASPNANLHFALAWSPFSEDGRRGWTSRSPPRATAWSSSTPSAVSTAAPTRWTPTR